jgi:alpha-galactosidase
MFGFMQRFGRDPRARWRGTGPMTRVRRRNHPLNCEALEGRQLLSGYYIVNASSGKVLDDPGGSTSNGAVIQQYQLDGGFNQQWTLNRVKGADFQFYDQIVNVSSGKVLDGVNGTKIVQNPPNSAAVDELWTLTKLQDGNYEVENVASKLVLEDPNSSPSNGTSVIEDQYKGGLNQQWVLVAAQAGSGRAATYTVQNSSSNQVLDDPNSSTSDGTKIIQYQPNGGANQKWTFVPLADGNVLIVNQASGLVLGDPGFSTSKGTGIIQWQPTGGMNEEWTIDHLANGSVVIVNAYSHLVLEDPVSSTSEGIQMDQWPWNGTANQEWKLNPA